MTIVFRSKVDAKLWAIGLAMPAVALIAIITSPRLSTGLLWLPVIATVLVAAIVVWMVLSTYYEFKGDTPRAVDGPPRNRFRRRSRIADLARGQGRFPRSAATASAAAGRGIVRVQRAELAHHAIGPAKSILQRIFAAATLAARADHIVFLD
jgi:hypothetical protein